MFVIAISEAFVVTFYSLLMNNNIGLSYLRVICCFSVFLLHWFARIGWRDYLWVWSYAVPCFFLMSSFIYGTRNDAKLISSFSFIKKRWVALSIVYYPFLLCLLVFYSITDLSNIRQYLIGFVSGISYFFDGVTVFPNCGHLWFIKTLVCCYVLLALFIDKPYLKETVRIKRYYIHFIFLSLLIGFFYRGSITVYLLFYLLIYFFSDKITAVGERMPIWAHFSIIIILLLLRGVKYEHYFWYGIYLSYYHTCILSIFLVYLFYKLKFKKNKYLLYLSNISFEFYLIHHLFVFDYPIYISLPITLVLSYILHYLSLKLKSFIFN